MESLIVINFFRLTTSLAPFKLCDLAKLMRFGKNFLVFWHFALPNNGFVFLTLSQVAFALERA